MTGDAPKPPGDLRAKALGLDSELEASARGASS